MAIDLNALHLLETDAGVIYNEIISQLEKYVDEPLYPGDERRIFGEALASVITSVYGYVDDRAKQRMLRYARGEVLDALGERVNTYRLAPSRAEVTIRFTLGAVRQENTLIPQGTRVTPDGVIYFAGAAAAFVPAGALYADVVCLAEQGGTLYNGYAPDMITTLVDLIPYVTGVTNTDTSSGGDGGEPYTTEGDGRFRERIRIAGPFSTAGAADAYEYYALSADADILSVKPISPGPGVVQLVTLMKDGLPPDGATVEKILAVCSAKTVRPLTDLVSVAAPEFAGYGITLTYSSSAVEQAAAIGGVEGEGGAIDRYIAWQGAELGRDIDPEELRRYIYTLGLATVRAEIAAPVYARLEANEAARFSGVLNVTYVPGGDG
jgi:phage-related baseplate assembly protein